MQKNSLILILIIAIFSNFILAAVPFKLRKAELLEREYDCPPGLVLCGTENCCFMGDNCCSDGSCCVAGYECCATECFSFKNYLIKARLLANEKLSKFRRKYTEQNQQPYQQSQQQQYQQQLLPQQKQHSSTTTKPPQRKMWPWKVTKKSTQTQSQPQTQLQPQLQPQPQPTPQPQDAFGSGTKCTESSFMVGFASMVLSSQKSNISIFDEQPSQNDEENRNKNEIDVEEEVPFGTGTQTLF
ncbi:hypothetical protein Glove_410g116 [Diversispora epigaea]|uniref:Granulins domain-containing protein n=1 Tax=Diversispora epigaea TaxID=1348612 RepID=A0A397H1W7_9GLOM|nr:hypothetical protein Glove_410g116 [Diversispora epigaea]